ncbi:MAG: helix-turn-helix transcriptional regulator [Clostridia bacterium]|nr:helix-turn-helix transcriptional regulator [Clostridia bacterium]
MEKKTIGTFLSALRKANGMTQQEVADKLNVSNKTVSKWERDEGCPEIMMLPAIAELYSVTVDEILRGEKSANTSHEETKSIKSEERLRYLIEKASVRLTNSSIIAVALGAVALILAYTVSDIVYNTVLWVGYVIILLLIAASITVEMISFNNFTSSIHNGDIVDTQLAEGITKKAVKYVTAVSFLMIVSLLGLALSIIFDGPTMLFVALPATAVAGGIAAYKIRCALYKKYNICEPELSPEQKSCRKKHIKITSVIIAVIIVVSVAFPFVSVAVESTIPCEFCFTNAVGYQYPNNETAESEYYKLKDYVTDYRCLYYLIDEEYREDTQKYVLYLQELNYVFNEGKNGYELTAVVALTAEKQFEFDSHTEARDFKNKNVYNEDSPMDELQKNISFDDETLTVSYQLNRDYIGQALDILPVFVIIGSCACIIAFAASVAVYYKKKSKLSA